MFFSNGIWHYHLLINQIKSQKKEKFNFVRDEKNIFQMRMNGGLSSEG